MLSPVCSVSLDVNYLMLTIPLNKVMTNFQINSTTLFDLVFFEILIYGHETTFLLKLCIETIPIVYNNVLYIYWLFFFLSVTAVQSLVIFNQNSKILILLWLHINILSLFDSNLPERETTHFIIFLFESNWNVNYPNFTGK